MITEDGDGWRNHPERKRWEGHLPALVRRHNMIVEEMERRGYNHKSPLLELEGRVRWPKPWQPVWKMKKILKEKQHAVLDSDL